MLVALIVMGNVTFAQKTGAKTSKKDTKAAATKQTATPAEKEVKTDKTKLKKDGTPDKRYKENKTKETTGPVKKDGTPDMRYKANKKKPANTTVATEKKK